jgi:hypothetical protein
VKSTKGYLVNRAKCKDVLAPSIAGWVKRLKIGAMIFPAKLILSLPILMPIVRDRDFNTQFIRVHQAIERSTSMLEQQTLTLDLLAQLILRYAENPPHLDKLGIEIQPVHRVRDYLEEHADREISLDQLSQIANLSPFHLNRWHSLPEVIV